MLWAFSYPGGALFTLLGSLCMWLLIGGWWSMRFVALAQSVVTSRADAYEFKHGWRGWFIAPVVVALTISLLAIRAPLRLRFGLSRGAFERAATAQPNGAGRLPAGWIGLYSVHYTWAEGECVYFATGGRVFDQDGFVYAPSGPPPDGWPLTTSSLGGGWHTFNIAD